MRQLTLFGDEIRRPEPETETRKTRQESLEDYEGFLSKFETKKTTDDCYTPEPVYRAVLDFVGTLTDLDGRDIVRPFFPGGDFVNHVYPERCVVVDNPPFSILSKIVRFYCANHIDFFLFAPALTLFQSGRFADASYVVTSCDVVYENGAIVRTSFVTNLLKDVRIWCCPQLKKAIEEAQAVPSKQKRGFVYPDNIVTAATLGKIVNHNTELRIMRQSCEFIGHGYYSSRLYGGAFLLSDRAAADRAAADRAEIERQERAAAKEAQKQTIPLNPIDMRIIEKLNRQEL